MAKYKAYPEYKDSGVEWLGEIPTHWDCTALKRLCSLITGLTPPTQNEDNYADEGYPWVRPEDLNVSGFGTRASKYVSDIGWKLLRHIKPHSTLICCIGTIGKCGYVNEKVSTNQQITAATFRDSERFNYYLLQAARAQLEELATGNVLKILNSERLGALNVVKVNCKEANTIAEFLDHQTAKIDNLIDKQQQLIELLKEKRQAVISHAVNKGLNPDVPMKDSGVEWLGEVPEHWVVTRLKYLINTFEQGWSPLCETRLADKYEYGVLKVGCVNSGEFNPLEHKALPSNLVPQKQYLVKKNDLLISRANTKELVGSSAVIEKDYDNLILCDKLYRVRFRNSINPYFISEFIRTPVIRKQIELSASGASHSMQNIGQDTIKELFIALPPENEALQLVSFIKNEIDVFESLIGLSNRQVVLLQERRTALISAAVTGKIDVRDWVAPDTQDVEESQEATA